MANSNKTETTVRDDLIAKAVAAVKALQTLRTAAEIADAPKAVRSPIKSSARKLAAVLGELTAMDS